MRQTSIFNLSKLVLATSLIAGVSAHAAPEISGRLMVGLKTGSTETTTTTAGKSTKVKSDDRTTLNSSGSRIRFKGTEALTDNTDLKYHLEYRIFVDNDGVNSKGVAQNFTSRQTTLTLSNKQYGDLMVGRYVSYDDMLDYDRGYYWSASETAAPMAHGADWVDNSITYTTPAIKQLGDIKLTAQYIMDEGEKTDDYFVVGAEKEVEDKYYVGATYKKKGDELSSLRIGGNVHLNKQYQSGFMLQHTDFNGKDDELGGFVNVAYSYSEPLKFWAQVGHAQNLDGVKDAEKTTANVGAFYFFNKKTRWFGSLGLGNTTTYEYDATNQKTKVEKDVLALETGFRYDF